MTVLVDASAIVAMATNEPEADMLSDVLDLHTDRLCCAIGLWEATLAVARKRRVPVSEARMELDSVVASLGLRVVPIAQLEGQIALDAFTRYGKGTKHRAQLNMGDCFAYACAKASNADLLYKGDDFAHTDLR